MSDIAIRVEKLSKEYHIGGPQKTYDRLGYHLADLFTSPFRRAGKLLRGQASGAAELDETIWALKDVSFEVGHGEVVGIIGRNGAGKSTLLKILSRITELTEGYVEIHGRVGSLLEVGTGFHPELTGRENIFLNGAILGMRRAEIMRKFDEIVAFAETEKFIDTPVKHYSSGMYMRLAFAVAAHLEPEILIVDEVLAVGDAMFQKKCLGKMGDVAKEGRTVLFVSHNLLAVENLCGSVIWLQDGAIAEQGPPGPVISAYLQHSFQTSTERVWPMSPAAEAEAVRLHRVSVRPYGGSAADPLTVHTPLSLEFEYWNLDPDSHVFVSFCLYNEHNILLFDICPALEPYWRRQPSPTGRLRSVCHIPGDFLNDGLHRVALTVWRNNASVIEEPEALVFNVEDSLEERYGWYGEWQGAIRPALEWETNVPLPAVGD